MRSLIAMAAVLGLFALAPMSALADDDSNRRERMLEKYDADGDGKLSREERKAANKGDRAKGHDGNRRDHAGRRDRDHRHKRRHEND
jgi:hypothetical protein